jgi:hypothetical protein
MDDPTASAKGEHAVTDDGPGPLLYVGFDIENREIAGLVDMVVGKRPIDPTEKTRRILAWTDTMQRVAREIDPSARVVPQSEDRLDHFGRFLIPWAIIWCAPSVDIEAMRTRLYAAGQFCGTVELCYTPPMA